MADTSVRSFAYRHPRYATNMAMDLVVGDTVILGKCESISENGIYARLADTLQPGAAGVATLYHGAESFSVHATIATIELGAGKQEYAALHFVFEDEEEKESVRSLVAKLKLRRIS